MPTLDPIVVNPPKEKKTYTFSDNDIKDISREVAQQEIAKIPTPASGTKLYKHEISLANGKSVRIVNLSSATIDTGSLANAFKDALVCYHIATGLKYLVNYLSGGGGGSPVTIKYLESDGSVGSVSSTVSSDTVTEL